jgi:hypothetical protein
MGCLVLIAVAASACSGAATTSLGEIETSLGTFSIKDVQLTDRFPPDCSAGKAGCNQAQSGYQIVIVWLEPVGQIDATTASIQFMKATDEVFVIASNGSQAKRAASGMYQSRYFVAFTPATTARGFTLSWPDNPEIDLGK